MSQNRKLILLTFALLASTLACRAATRLIIPDTPTPIAIPATLTATLLPPTATEAVGATCPSLLADILDKATSDSGEDTSSENNSDDWKYAVRYTISDDQLGTRSDILSSKLVQGADDTRATHEALWDYFAAIIPSSQREELTEFSAVTDGKDNILAAVAQTYDNPFQWELDIDVLDSRDSYTLTYTLVHEFGHLLTLNATQVPPNKQVFNNPDDDNIYKKAVDACPQYFTGEGCSNTDAYINTFFDRFWTDIYDEWQTIDQIDNEEKRDKKLEDFYDTYQDQFLTTYAPTNPAEDIAESWAFFTLSPKPASDSIANEKILFFYEYPELVQLRERIINNICVSFPH